MEPIIGIFGGTFDPIHLGHLHIAQTVCTQCKLSKLYLVPCWCAPNRSAPLANAQERLAMVHLALQDYPSLELYTKEALTPKPSYTVTTLQTWPHKGERLCLLLGMDAYNNFTSWYQWQTILELANLIVVNRKATPLVLSPYLKNHITTDPEALKNSKAGTILLLTIPTLPIAATQIRRLIQTHGNAKAYLPQAVWEYIVAKKLYNIAEPEIIC